MTDAAKHNPGLLRMRHQIQRNNNGSSNKPILEQPTRFNKKDAILKKLAIGSPDLPDVTTKFKKAKTVKTAASTANKHVNKVDNLADINHKANLDNKTLDNLGIPAEVVIEESTNISAMAATTASMSIGNQIIPGGLGFSLKLLAQNLFLPKNDPKLSEEFMDLLAINNDKERDEKIWAHFKSKNQLSINRLKNYNIDSDKNKKMRHIQAKIDQQGMTAQDCKSLVAVFHQLALQHQKRSVEKSKIFSSKRGLNAQEKKNFLRSLRSYAGMYIAKSE